MNETSKVVTTVLAASTGASAYHHLNTMDVQVGVYDPSNRLMSDCGIQIMNSGEIKIVSPYWMPPGTLLRVVIIG